MCVRAHVRERECVCARERMRVYVFVSASARAHVLTTTFQSTCSYPLTPIHQQMEKNTMAVYAPKPTPFLASLFRHIDRHIDGHLVGQTDRQTARRIGRHFTHSPNHILD